MHRGWVRGVAVLLSSLVLAIGTAGCGKGVVEARPLTVAMDDYKTATVDFDPKSAENGEKAAPGFIAYLETKLKTTGAFEPAPAEAAQMVLRVRPGPGAGMDDDLHLLVDFVDTKTRATVGQLEITASTSGKKSEAALRQAADGIAAYVREHRRAPLKIAKGNTDVAPSTFSAAGPAAPTPGVVVKDNCTTTCKSDSTTAATPEDLQRIAEGTAPTLGQMRVCLDRVSAQNINPSMILRFESAGLPSSIRHDAGGYEELACVLEAKSRLPPLTTSRTASLRCEHRCQR